MLHRRCLPQNEHDDLKLVFDFKIELLDWLLRTPPVNLGNKSVLLAKFGQAKGNWLWRRIRSPAKRTHFGFAIDHLIAASKADPIGANFVASAIAADIKFDTDWGVPGFSLVFPRFFSGWLDAIKNVASPFYNWFASDDGFNEQVFALRHGNMTRARLMESFRKQACGVCGYCDGETGEKGRKKDANDCDHFFPQSYWPHLAIHPRNLYAACKECNETWKLNSKPMGAGDVAGLDGTYHPMFRPGIDSIQVSATQSVISPRKVSIDLVDGLVPVRTQTLNSSLDLEARWENWANEKLDRKISAFVSRVVKQRKSNQPMTEAELAGYIGTDIMWIEEHMGVEPNGLRLKAVLQYQQQAQLPQILADL